MLIFQSVVEQRIKSKAVVKAKPLLKKEGLPAQATQRRKK
jgi:hypothetical protein